MTLGTFSLMLLETDPVGSSVNDFATIVAPSEDPYQSVGDTLVPVRDDQWRGIVIEAATDSVQTLTGNYHFLLDVGEDGKPVITRTALWQNQDQLTGNGPARSIRVCVRGEYLSANPSVETFRLLVGLMHRLQQIASISAERVYLPGDYDVRAPHFSEDFATAFHRNLAR
ncbi:MAG: hypothetical protein ACLFV7_09275 [Phycisphaerae bacterium]